MEKDINIDGREYRIAQYRVHKRMVFHGQLTKLMGYGAKVADGIVNGMVDENIQLDQIGIGDAIKNIMDKLDPEEHTKFVLGTIKELTMSPKQCGPDSTEQQFESYFTEHFPDTYPLFAEIVEHNITDSISESLKKKLAYYASTMLGFIAEPEEQKQSKQDSQNQKN